mmetsp:Transcript_13117/g.15866  ORF Transcript_13117/g.15866 Transcript_13117/m.15866 type:complete len:96 (-) Transcript_13117:1608-1895(-)
MREEVTGGVMETGAAVQAEIMVVHSGEIGVAGTEREKAMVIDVAVTETVTAVAKEDTEIAMGGAVTAVTGTLVQVAGILTNQFSHLGSHQSVRKL